MRIACVHVPQFALQCVTRIDPALRGAPVVVVGAGIDPGAGAAARIALHSPVVQACSRAAWALGVRIGMTATSARALSPELRVVSADPQLERDTVRAVADVLLGASAVVDPGGRVGPGGSHLALYCEVPSKTRGTSFGERLIDRLAELGLTGRIGIADDRFTAWVAASHSGEGRLDDAGVVSVPRGGSAAFLAPRPLALLAISPEVLHMLEALGVRTLGEFAALPAPSVARPFEADYQALARGDSGSALRPYAPDAPIREEAAI
ncbi:MAG: DNA polymerase Y family protein, partial [Kofleriaceae bacterium]